MIICAVFALIFALAHVYLPHHCELIVLFLPENVVGAIIFSFAFSQYCKSLSCAVLHQAPIELVEKHLELHPRPG
jgi:hypothetical protein